MSRKRPAETDPDLKKLEAALRAVQRAVAALRKKGDVTIRFTVNVKPRNTEAAKK